MAPTVTALMKETFISALTANTLRSRAKVRALAPIEESANAARNPPWMRPVGLANRSSASIRHTVRPGSLLSRQTMPSVRSELGGTWTRRSVGGTVRSVLAAFYGQPASEVHDPRQCVMLVGGGTGGTRPTAAQGAAAPGPFVARCPRRHRHPPQLPGRTRGGRPVTASESGVRPGVYPLLCR